ncbi:MAG: hypothetical protein HY569_00505 [Candidatus Magasanikbacteria bacterium]|nr:hypothetical protein [Candidatus Magasanikbacteria bacterium]
MPTPEQEERGEMKLENRARKMSFTDRVRHAWNNTPGETAVEKQEYLFLRNATDALQQIFGLGSPAYAQLFMDRLRQNDLIIGTDGSYYWANDMSNYSETDGPKPGPRSRASEPPSEDVADDAGESTETDEVDSNDLHIVLARAPWMASVLRAAALLGQIAPDARILALEAIRKIAALPEENLPQALNTLNAIFHESLPAEEPEFE